MKKAQITREVRGFGGAVSTVTETIDIKEGEPVPEGAVIVENTPDSGEEEA